ncbi:MAG TPA: STAS domain-containing protein [Pyrinomonadaceae bacterium]|jgi:anti-anti-sigma regulatory factor|nr:STAS domain-containing protein [Pyrinomonadaceae bacterium]
MGNSHDRSPVRSERNGDIAIIYASDYLNKLSGERVERECRVQLDAGCRALVVDFKNTGLVNSIGVSIMLGVIDAAERASAPLVFSNVNAQAAQLFEILGLTRHALLARDEADALAMLSEVNAPPHGRQVPVGRHT